MNLIKKGSASLLSEGLTLDLAIYECLNVVWKECKLLKRLDEETASSLIELIGDALSILRMDSIKGSENEVFDLARREGLTIYELGNATWKLTRIRKIKPEEAFAVLEALTGIYGKMRKTKIKDHEKTLKIVQRENPTFYDAAYMSAAIENNLTLITDDEKLYKAARKYIKVLKSQEIK